MGNEFDQLIAQIETEATALIAVARYVLAKRAVEYNVRDIDLVIAGALQKQGLNIHERR